MRILTEILLNCSKWHKSVIIIQWVPFPWVLLPAYNSPDWHLYFYLSSMSDCLRENKPKKSLTLASLPQIGTNIQEHRVKRVSLERHKLCLRTRFCGFKALCFIILWFHYGFRVAVDCGLRLFGVEPAAWFVLILVDGLSCLVGFDDYISILITGLDSTFPQCYLKDHPVLLARTHFRSLSFSMRTELFITLGQGEERGCRLSCRRVDWHQILFAYS